MLTSVKSLTGKRGDMQLGQPEQTREKGRRLQVDLRTAVEMDPDSPSGSCRNSGRQK